MGRLLIFLGFILTIVGVALGGANLVNAIQGSVAPAMTGPIESEVCQAGESLIEEQGAVENVPGGGTRRSVLYYCVSADGTRRNVTGEFVEDLFNSLINSLPSLGIGLIFLFLPCIGIPLMVVGVIVMLIRRKPDSVVS